MKRCCHCREYRDESEFGLNKSNKDGYQETCKKCRKEYRLKNSDKIKESKKIYYYKNRDKLLKISKTYRNSNKGKVKEYQLKYKYNIDKIQYDFLMKKANYKCEICGSIKKLHIDHNHRTDKIRGILCSKCNISIGLVDENLIILSNMLQYLKDRINI